MPTLTSALKNEYTKQILRATGIRPASLQQRKTPHYRMPILKEAGGHLVLDRYRGCHGYLLDPQADWRHPHFGERGP